MPFGIKFKNIKEKVKKKELIRLNPKKKTNKNQKEEKAKFVN